MSDLARKPLSSAGRRHALLEARTRRLARRRVAAEMLPTVSCLICEAGGQLYALPLTRIARVGAATRPAPVPSANRALLGVTGRAGVFYHVYDLALLMGGGGGGGGHLVMLRGSSPIALRVDTAVRVADLSMIDAAESANLRATHPAISGFARAAQNELFDGRMLSLIDPDKLASAVEAERVEGDQA
jgi:chemotaxis signal transduction protein